MSTFTIHYFASASTYTNKNTESLPAPLPLSQLFSTLESKYPGIKESVLGSCSVAVGGEYVDVPADGEGPEGVVIGSGEEVAIIPPVRPFTRLHCTIYTLIEVDFCLSLFREIDDVRLWSSSKVTRGLSTARG
ncbi:MoaD/ThiS family protein [Aspergillus stella-maris]|uniref:MoaD/ThiS family protein n=1 Tax=Aspergillus stella-maris TaxID=1810926 RepID=UPI003CCDCF1A